MFSHVILRNCRENEITTASSVKIEIQSFDLKRRSAHCINRATICLVQLKTFLLLSIINKIIRHSRHSEESNLAAPGG